MPKYWNKLHKQTEVGTRTVFYQNCNLWIKNDHFYWTVVCSALAVGVCTQTLVGFFILAWLVCMLQPGRVEGRAVSRKPLKCFPICPADSADSDSRTPVPHWLTFPPTLYRDLHPNFFLLLFLGWILMSRSRHRADNQMILFLFLSTLASLSDYILGFSPHKTFSQCLPAAYHRVESPSLPPACLCRPGWTHAGRF